MLTHQAGPILDLISVRLLDAAHRNVNKKCALFFKTLGKYLIDFF